MLKPITCKCKNNLGWFETSNGNLRVEGLPDGIKGVWGITFNCAECKRIYIFDGKRAGKIQHRQEKAVKIEIEVVENVEI